MAVRAIHHANLFGTCGAGLVASFINTHSNYGVTLDNVGAGGTGIFCAGFVGTNVCKEAYEELKGNYKIVYQSPKRRNNNSGRQFIFVVYDRRLKKSQDMNKDFEFPFTRLTRS